MYEQILYEVDDPIATITLNRPERLNAFTGQMGNELKHAIAEAEADRAVVAILLTGAGRGFCAGADLEDLKKISEGNEHSHSRQRFDVDLGDPAMKDFRKPYAYLFSVRKPVIAAINGPIAGIGLAISLFCDLRFASDKAVFTTAFARRGLIAEWGLAWTLPRLVGTAHATDLLFSARRIDAVEADRIGLVNRTVPNDELLPFVRHYARDIGASCSPTSLQIMKRQIYRGLTENCDASLAEANQLMERSLKRPDFKEGVSSFLEKRQPIFDRIGDSERLP